MMKTVCFLLLVASSLHVTLSQSTGHRPVAFETRHTKLGYIQGKRETVEGTGRVFYSFLGIPYARPPVGELRWKPPQPAGQWSETLNATGFRSICTQLVGRDGDYTVHGREDCLYLNVYTPQLPVIRDSRQRTPVRVSTSPLPVLVYIHGDTFRDGSSSDYGASKFMREDVVLVTFNYRLGAFGYLSTGCSALPGNWGQLDQVKALRWISDNIRDYGGDNTRVTIFGNFAGAASVHMLMLSPAARPYFHRAIMQSGSALCNWAIDENPKKTADAIAEMLDCSTSPHDLVECLMEKSAPEIIRAQENIEKWPFPTGLTPVVDGEFREEPFLPAHPRVMLKEGNYSYVPTIMGVTKDEGLYFYYNILERHIGDGMQDGEYLEGTLIPELVDGVSGGDEHSLTVTDAVKNYYFSGEDIRDLHRQLPLMSELLGDATMFSCFRESLSFHSKSSQPLYAYVFSHRNHDTPSLSEYSVQNLRRRILGDHWLLHYGVPHGDELMYLFDVTGRHRPRSFVSNRDKELSQAMVHMWASFAKDGKPSSWQRTGQVWGPVRKGSLHYFNITANTAPMGDDYRSGEADFWTNTVPYVNGLGQQIDELYDYWLATWILVGVCVFLLIVILILVILLVRRRKSY